MPKHKLLLFATTVALLATRASQAADYPTTVLADNPLAYYRLEETSGTTAVDSSSTGAYPGTYNPNGSYPILGLPGIDVNCIGLSSATPSSVTVGYYDAMNQQAPFSFEIWCRPISTSTTLYRCPIGNFSGYGFANVSGWYIYQQPGSPSTWAFVTQPSGAYITSSALTPLNWYHLVGTFDGTNATFYINGAAVGTQNATGYQANSVNNAGMVTLGIGQRGDSYGYFDGDVDEVAYYTNVLTAAQVLNHYNVGTNSFRVALLPPTLSVGAVSTNAYAGHSVNFDVLADGTQPISYQWYKGTAAVPGATNNIYSFVCAPTDDASTYYVVVTNIAGAVTSSVASLAVSTDIVVLAPLTDITRNVGSSAAFEIAADGALPLTYQWYNSDASIIAGATNSALWLTNIQASADQSSYYVTISNPYTSIDSDPATLSVQARAVNVSTNGYARIVLADGPVAYWRLDEASGAATAVDAVGSFDGSYLPASGTITYGATNGIPNGTNASVTLTNGATVNIPYAIEINPPGPFTIEGWVSASSVPTNGEYRTAMSSLSNPYRAGPTGWLVYQTEFNNWSWWPYNGYYNGVQLTDNEQVVPGRWYYLTLVYDGATFTFYVNGVAKASGQDAGFVQNGNVPTGGAVNYNYNYNTGVGLPDGSGAMVLGYRSDVDFHPFLGGIDEVAVYNKALTPLQIQSHLINSPAITIGPAGQSAVINWSAGTLQSAPAVTGPYTDVTGATPPYTNTPSVTPEFYRIKF